VEDTYSDTVNQRRGLIPEDLMQFRWLDEIALAPDASQVAYTIRRPDADSNGYITHLYVRELSDLSARRLTSGNCQVSSLAWSRDSSQLAYSYRDETTKSVRVRNIADDTDTIYSTDGSPLSSMDWSADGTKLVGVRWTKISRFDDRGSVDGIPKPTVKVVRRLRYKQDGVGWVHDRFTQIWVLELTTGDFVQVTHSECDYSSPKWSNNGARLAFVGMAREQNIPLGYGQIFTCQFPDGHPQLLLKDWQGTAVSPMWGNDDKCIAFAGHNIAPPVNRRNFWQPQLADVEAGTATKLGEDIDEEVGNYAVADQRKGLANVTMKWAAGDDWIYFLMTEQGATNLYRINTSGDYEKLVSGDSVTFEYSPAVGGRVAYGQADPSNPGELFFRDDEHTQKFTDLNPWLRDHHLAVPESYWYDGVDDAKVHAWLMKPLDFDPQKQYPLVLYVHCSMFSWDFNHEFQVYVNRGYAVAYFNQRGTTAGYGQAWTKASEGDQGGKDYEEIMLGVDELVSRPYIDGDRMGVTGGSCGGFMTNWVVGHTDRFAAAVTQRSITNQISFFGTSDIGPECTGGETRTDPWRDLQSSWRQSPVAYIDNINTPLLIIHSDEDYRCALEQAEQMFAALRWRRKPVELVIFEGENHGLSRGGRPGNRIERQHRILEWFKKYMGIAPILLPS
jgi:dipeptidyl aminopeptidase/acylaminoacyl peptidase